MKLLKGGLNYSFEVRTGFWIFRVLIVISWNGIIKNFFPERCTEFFQSYYPSVLAKENMTKLFRGW